MLNGYTKSGAPKPNLLRTITARPSIPALRTRQENLQLFQNKLELELGRRNILQFDKLE